MSKSNSYLAINGGTPVSKVKIPIHKTYLDQSDKKAVLDTLDSTFISGNGPSGMKFEKLLAEYLGVKHVLFTNSCTSALDLAFRVKNFKPGSEVIVPNFTYTSSALGPLLNGLRVKLVDVYANNGSIDVSKIEPAINKNTVAIVPVDYAGNPADMAPIEKIANKYNLYVVHDTAQSIGSKYRNIKTGNFGNVSTFSFHGTKNLTTGEGGAFVTNDDELAEKALYMREKGTDKQSFLVDSRDRGFYEYVDIGNSYVQSNLLGSLGISQLDKIDWMNKERKIIAEYYKKGLKEIQNIDFIQNTEGCEVNWHLFGILVPSGHRYWIMDALRAEGVMANVHYTPLHRNKFYMGLATDEEMKGSMQFFSGLLRLPIYPSLTMEEQEKVIEATRKVMGVLNV